MSDKPKRPMSAYMLWLNSAREKIKADNPGLKVTEIAKKGGEIWRSMTDKSDWEEKAAEAKEQYTKDLVSYEVNVELARRLDSIGDGVVKSLANWKRLSEETQPQPSSSETGQSASPSLSNPNAPPQQSAVEPAPSAASVSRDPDAATSQATQEAQRTRPRRNRDENLPDWAYDLEERRIAVEERIAQEIAGLGETNRAILGCLQQLIQLLQEHNMNS